jgi:hypothetical protein
MTLPSSNRKPSSQLVQPLSASAGSFGARTGMFGLLFWHTTPQITSVVLITGCFRTDFRAATGSQMRLRSDIRSRSTCCG